MEVVEGEQVELDVPAGRGRLGELAVDGALAVRPVVGGARGAGRAAQPEGEGGEGGDRECAGATDGGFHRFSLKAGPEDRAGEVVDPRRLTPGADASPAFAEDAPARWRAVRGWGVEHGHSSSDASMPRHRRTRSPEVPNTSVEQPGPPDRPSGPARTRRGPGGLRAPARRPRRRAARARRARGPGRPAARDRRGPDLADLRRADGRRGARGPPPPPAGRSPPPRSRCAR